MIIIHDKRLPGDAIKNLEKYGERLPLYTENITYPEIAGHPDIFFFPAGKFIIAAPNTPEYYINYFKDKKIAFKFGNNPVGNRKETSACYNAAMTENYVIHNKKFTDPAILENIGHKTFIHVNQAYTRCSLLPLKNDCFITSDKGIEKELIKYGLDYLYISPEEILLPGHRHGFIGGCMGVYENSVFLTGNLNRHPDGKKLDSFLRERNYNIISLYDGKLFDGGGIFFWNI
jgi:hypothetical protein